MRKILGTTNDALIPLNAPMLIMLLGIFLRVFLYPSVPPGLNQDEAASAYEAYSLILTGKDQWGNPFPAHFPGWGAGQSVLYAYLTIPAIKLLGLTPMASRSTSVILGILTLPIIYRLTQRVFDSQTALIALLLTAVSPWHVMMSRWGLDCNLLPFFLLLGCSWVQLAVSQKQRRWILISLIPWALALYAYGISLLIVPFLLLLTFLVYRQPILKARLPWLGAIIIFGFLALPLFLYVLKDYFVKGELGIEQWLPFSIPLFPSQRFSQVNQGIFDNIFANLKLIFSGFDDGKIWNVFPPFLPLYLIPLPFLLVGLFILLRRRQNRFQNIFLLWLLACVPLLLAVEVNVNRGNAIFLPIIVISAYGVQQLYEAISPQVLRRMLKVAVIIWVSLSTLLFAGRYFFDYPAIAARSFRYGLGEALESAVQMANESEPILVTDQIPLDYMNVLYLQKISPVFFQDKANLIVSVDNVGLYDVDRVGRFYFKLEALKQTQPNVESFISVFQSDEEWPCASEPQSQGKYWQVGRCLSKFSLDSNS